MDFNSKLKSKNGGSMAGGKELGLDGNQAAMIAGLKGGRPNEYRTHKPFTWVDLYPAPGAAGEIAPLGSAKGTPHDPWQFSYGQGKASK